MSKVINWTQYFMGVAKLSAFRSKDPNTQVGACIVNEANKIVGVGYNGLPWGCEDNEFPWEVREGDLYETKYPYVVHAELNAILNSTGQLKGCRTAKRMLDAAGVKYTKVEPFVIEVK